MTEYQNWADQDDEHGNIEPKDDPTYIAGRLMDIEAAIYRGPVELDYRRREAARLTAAYDVAKARALAEIRADGEKYTASERDAKVILATLKEREAAANADAALEYAKDVNRALDREKDSLQTRSANLRAQMQLAGTGRA
ncbi:hypothetical protein KDJ57_gp62 [Gordonia phage Catfish]|uniref:Uncharacterized protein n=1 Tax=Gordonia phage Catfish TaxID=2301538 RepID=A0A385D0K9_9CAUD|nr:hypothetical protein KDJ57_gp62 [Gordonia phage Catfish]AXQ51883.1 hypothetical protein SEA_CATFISH_47 [Gordonia phage Catfish]